LGDARAELLNDCTPCTCRYINNAFAGVTICTIDGSGDLVQCSGNQGLLTDGTTAAFSGSQFIRWYNGKAYVINSNGGVVICTNPTQVGRYTGRGRAGNATSS